MGSILLFKFSDLIESFVKFVSQSDDNSYDKCKVYMYVKSDDKPDDNSEDKCKVSVKLGW